VGVALQKRPRKLFAVLTATCKSGRGLQAESLVRPVVTNFELAGLCITGRRAPTYALVVP